MRYNKAAVLKKKDLNIIIILLISLIAFWQILSLRNCLKWDFEDITLPWRFFIGESIQNGQIPLWVPYAKLGFPLYFDPQTWYPVSWLIGLTTGYTVFTVQAEYVLHIFLAGLGMFFFMKHFSDDSGIRIIAAVSFMLSGFFIGNAQHMGWIVSGAWIPFIFNSYLNIYKQKSWLPVFSFTLFLFLLFTGGYFPFFITTVYSVTGIFIFKTYKYFKTKNFNDIKIITTKHLLFLITFILISSVVFLSLSETKEFIGRGNGISVEKALTQSIEKEALITFIFPFSVTWGDANFWGADKTVINSYFGLLPFLILTFGLFVRKNKTEKLFLYLGIFAYIIAMGNIFPVRRFLYYTLPFFNYFRFPSLFRYFGIFSFSVFSALMLKKIILNQLYFKKFLFFLIGILILFIFIFIFSYVKIQEINLRFYNWFAYIKTISLSETIVIQSIVHIIVLFGILFFLYFTQKNASLKLTFFLIFIIFDMLFFVQLNAPNTVYSVADASLLQKNLDKLPKNYPVPDNSEKIIDVKKKMKGIFPLWRNLGFYYKEIDYKGYGPYQLNNFTKFEKSGFFYDLLNNPLFYFAKNIIPVNNPDTTFVKNNSEGLVLTDNMNLTNKNLENPKKSTIKIISFAPKSVELKTYCNKKSLLIFMQNYKPDQKVYVDHTEQKIYPVNYSLQGVIIPKGNHSVKFSFINKKITTSFYISSAFFIILLFVILFLLFTKKNNT